jgi:hypothetical protein
MVAPRRLVMWGADVFCVVVLCRCVLTVLCMWELRREWQAFITLRHQHLMQHAPHLYDRHTMMRQEQGCDW